MHSAVFLFSIFVSLLVGIISDEAISDSAHTTAEEEITHLTELIQSAPLFPVARISRSPRTGQKASVDDTSFICGIYNPCGWLTYEKSTRHLQEWHLSRCDCREGMECARYTDKINMAAYEYRCRNKTYLATE